MVRSKSAVALSYGRQVVLKFLDCIQAQRRSFPNMFVLCKFDLQSGESPLRKPLPTRPTRPEQVMIYGRFPDLQLLDISPSQQNLPVA